MGFAGRHQLGHEVRTEYDIGIQAQHPFAARNADRLVLPGSESHIAIIVEDSPFCFDLLQPRARAVLRGVVDDDHFEVGIVEERECTETFVKVLRRIPGDDGDGYNWSRTLTAQNPV